MALQNSIVAEGQLINRPLLFDGSNYAYQSTKISIYFRALENQMWDVIMERPYIPTSPSFVMGEKILIPRAEQIEVEVKKIQTNFEAINTLHCTLTPIEFNKISGCTTNKEIWEKLRVIHVRTSQVKKSKIALLTHNYKIFKMEPSEDISTMFDRFTNITNKLNQLGKTILEHELVERSLKCLPKS